MAVAAGAVSRPPGPVPAGGSRQGTAEDLLDLRESHSDARPVDTLEVLGQRRVRAPARCGSCRGGLRSARRRSIGRRTGVEGSLLALGEVLGGHLDDCGPVAEPVDEPEAAVLGAGVDSKVVEA